MSGWFWLFGTRKRKQCYHTEVKINKGNKKGILTRPTVFLSPFILGSANLQVQKITTTIRCLVATKKIYEGTGQR